MQGGLYAKGGTVLPRPFPGGAGVYNERTRLVYQNTPQGKPVIGVPVKPRYIPGSGDQGNAPAPYAGLYARGGTVGGGGDGSGGAEFRGNFQPVRAAAPAPAQQQLRRGVGPTDGGMMPRTGPKPMMAAGGMRMRGYADGGEIVAPAAVPDDGITDNVPIMADEGEFVITRDAAVAYDPAVLEAINDPQMAPIIEMLISEYLAEMGGMNGESGMDDGSEVLPPVQQPAGQQQRPQSPLGRMRA